MGRFEKLMACLHWDSKEGPQLHTTAEPQDRRKGADHRSRTGPTLRGKIPAYSSLFLVSLAAPQIRNWSGLIWLCRNSNYFTELFKLMSFLFFFLHIFTSFIHFSPKQYIDFKTGLQNIFVSLIKNGVK